MKPNFRKPTLSNRILLVALALLVSGPAVRAAGLSLYKDKEVCYDLYSGYMAPQESTSGVFKNCFDNGTWGGGMGVNYFASRYVGMGSDIHIANNRGSFVDYVTGNLILRVPLGQSGIAPYAFGGGGSGYEPSAQWVGQAGFGLEYRSESKLGFFADGRYVWGEKSGSDNSLIRFGMRFVY